MFLLNENGDREQSCDRYNQLSNGNIVQNTQDYNLE
jgi:hypothetical protein